MEQAASCAHHLEQASCRAHALMVPVAAILVPTLQLENTFYRQPLENTFYRQAPVRRRHGLGGSMAWRALGCRLVLASMLVHVLAGIPRFPLSSVPAW